MPRSTIQYNTVQCSGYQGRVQYSEEQCSAASTTYNIVKYSKVQCSEEQN